MISEIRNCQRGYSPPLPLSLTTNETAPHSCRALLALQLLTPNLSAGMGPANISLSL